MNYEFKEINDQIVWKNFEEKYHESESFFQSWEWSELEKSLGHEAFRLGIYKNGNPDVLVGIMLIVFINAKRGRLLHVRTGPLIDWENEELVAETATYLRLFGISKECSYVRISPLINNSRENQELMKKLGMHQAQMHAVDGEITWMLSLEQSEEEILAGMRKNTRYYINRAKKDGVHILKTMNPDELVKFWPIFLDTVKRQDWKAHPYEHIYNEFKMFAKAGKAMLILAKYNGDYIAGAIFIFHKGTAYYHHSASLTAYRKIPAPYLIQWTAIKEAKSRGMKMYNFYGVAPTDNSKHPWAGLTFFKKGFGGYMEEHLHAYDLPLQKRYWMTNLFEMVERKRGGY